MQISFSDIKSIRHNKDDYYYIQLKDSLNYIYAMIQSNEFFGVDFICFQKETSPYSIIKIPLPFPNKRVTSQGISLLRTF